MVIDLIIVAILVISILIGIKIGLIKSLINLAAIFLSIIIAETGNEAKIINKLGWLIKTFKTSRNIKQISMAQNVVAIIYKSKIEILSI